jgi:hypothetical protein
LNDHTITLTPAPAKDSVVTIKRDTEIEERLVDFSDGAALKETELDTAFTQLFHIVQELRDYIDVDAATASASSASRSADAAAGSASDAAGSAAAALASATAAALSEGAALGSENAAAASERSASEYALAAAESASHAYAASAPPWDPSIEYVFPQTVAGNDGHTYRCTGISQVGVPPSLDETNWTRLTAVTEGFFELDPEDGTGGSLMPALVTGYSNEWTLDADGDIMPRL